MENKTQREQENELPLELRQAENSQEENEWIEDERTLLISQEHEAELMKAVPIIHCLLCRLWVARREPVLRLLLSGKRAPSGICILESCYF